MKVAPSAKIGEKVEKAEKNPFPEQPSTDHREILCLMAKFMVWYRQSENGHPEKTNAIEGKGGAIGRIMRADKNMLSDCSWPNW